MLHMSRPAVDHDGSVTRTVFRRLVLLLAGGIFHVGDLPGARLLILDTGYAADASIVDVVLKVFS
jgi:hypothetical protein